MRHLQAKENGKWRHDPPLKRSLKRYWQTELWTRLFETLLDASGGGRDLGKLADELEQHLDDKLLRRQNLKQALQSQFSILREARMLPR